MPDREEIDKLVNNLRNLKPANKVEFEIVITPGTVQTLVLYFVLGLALSFLATQGNLIWAIVVALLTARRIVNWVQDVGDSENKRQIIHVERRRAEESESDENQ